MKLRPIRSTAKIKRKKPPMKLKASVSRAASRRQIEEFEDDEEDYYESSEPNMKLSHAFIVVLILHLIAVGGIFGFNAMKNRQATLAKIAAESGLVAQPKPAASEVESSALPTGPSAGTHPSAAVSQSASSTAPAANVPAQATTGRTHEVVPGDTLTRIATKYGTTVEALLTTNNLTADSILRVGQILQLPVAGTAPVAATATAPKPSAAANPTANRPPTQTAPAPQTAATTQTPTTPVANTGEIYEVVAGDNPYSIAKRLKVSYQDLLELNGITDPTKLQIGQKLKVPPPR